ncbi:beta-L-arabinofuranosidase domain-containing protein [Hoylesella oralis]|uniref:glycoside hydrolase family 127 protein n=1 Tax=Hoylesella oralis TaxID=28134 RepID=UPI0028E5D6AD|nr:beta-L-arabinofuranosidase domain-containing protein [Hoylesella oralis]
MKIVVKDAFVPDKVEILTGYVGEKITASYNHRILAQNIDKLVEPFANKVEDHLWQSEFWGKWMNSAVLAYRYKPSNQLLDNMRTAVDKLIATQDKNGYIGNYAPEYHLHEWDIWGRKYCILGLLDYYGITKEKKALVAACREADFLMAELKAKNTSIVSMGNHRGMAASSVLKPICYLYRYTGNKKYLDFALQIVREWETSDGPQLISKADIPVGKRFPRPDYDNWYKWQQGQKAYEMMSCYEGLLELYRLTGNVTYLSAVEKTWQSIMDTEINITGSGSAMESWFGGKQVQYMPIKHYQETCVTATWIKLSRQLLMLTGNSKYADAIEQSLYNALLGAMKSDGSDWAKYTPLSGQRLQGSEQCGMGLNCCTASGPRGLFIIPQTAVMQSIKGAVINLYIPGTYTLQSPKGQEIIITQQGDYPQTGTVRIAFKVKQTEEFTLSLRIPEWSKDTKVTLNGNDVVPAHNGSYLQINRKWSDGDHVELVLDMRAQLHFMGENPQYLAITRGPIVLTRDARLSGADVQAIITPDVDKNGNLDLIPVANRNPNIWMMFKACFYPESYKEEEPEPIEVELCDYASAGNATSSFPFFKVWMPQLYNPRGK